MSLQSLVGVETMCNETFEKNIWYLTFEFTAYGTK